VTRYGDMRGRIRSNPDVAALPTRPRAGWMRTHNGQGREGAAAGRL